MSARFAAEQRRPNASADVDGMLALLDALPEHPLAIVRTLFDGCQRLVLTRAPGRLDVMGGIADYSGARVLQWPIAEAVVCVAGLAIDSNVRIVSLGAEENNRAATFEIPLSGLMKPDGAVDYTSVRQALRQQPSSAWAAYVAGAVVVLAGEMGVRFTNGLRLLIASSVPEGRGLSSSAALEVAALSAVATLLGVELEGPQLARLAQIVENQIVGAPCGLMDQMASTCGQAGQFLSMVCQPALLEPPVRMPAGITVWGIDSGVRHSVGGNAYTAARVAAFMGYRVLAEAAGLSVQPLQPGRVRITDPTWGGYLANVGIAQWRDLSAALPQAMRGDAFLARYHGITDLVTDVDPSFTYVVRAATGHPVLEHLRVTAFAGALQQGAPSHAVLTAMGELMYQSHESYAACGLDCSETAWLVNQVRAQGPPRGLYGAKVTGGGSGGTVAVLGLSSAADTLQELVQQYETATGRKARIIVGSSPGAKSFGCIPLAAC